MTRRRAEIRRRAGKRGARRTALRAVLRAAKGRSAAPSVRAPPARTIFLMGEEEWMKEERAERRGKRFWEEEESFSAHWVLGSVFVEF